MANKRNHEPQSNTACNPCQRIKFSDLGPGLKVSGLEQEFDERKADNRDEHINPELSKNNFRIIRMDDGLVLVFQDDYQAIKSNGNVPSLAARIVERINETGAVIRKNVENEYSPGKRFEIAEKDGVAKTRAVNYDQESVVGETIIFQGSYERSMELLEEPMDEEHFFDLLGKAGITLYDDEAYTERLNHFGRFPEFFLDTFLFVDEHFGKNNVVDFHMDLDERTPHVHCVVVPLIRMGGEYRSPVYDKDENGKTRKDKNGNRIIKVGAYGEPLYKTTVKKEKWHLNANRLFNGGKNGAMRKLWDDYGRAMEPYGLTIAVGRNIPYDPETDIDVARMRDEKKQLERQIRELKDTKKGEEASLQQIKLIIDKTGADLQGLLKEAAAAKTVIQQAAGMDEAIKQGTAELGQLRDEIGDARDVLRKIKENPAFREGEFRFPWDRVRLNHEDLYVVTEKKNAFGKRETVVEPKKPEEIVAVVESKLKEKYQETLDGANEKIAAMKVQQDDANKTRDSWLALCEKVSGLLDQDYANWRETDPIECTRSMHDLMEQFPNDELREHFLSKSLAPEIRLKSIPWFKDFKLKRLLEFSVPNNSQREDVARRIVVEDPWGRSYRIEDNTYVSGADAPEVYPRRVDLTRLTDDEWKKVQTVLGQFLSDHLTVDDLEALQTGKTLRQVMRSKGCDGADKAIDYDILSRRRGRGI